MDDALNRIFNDFDRGRISRRHLLQILGVAAVGAPLSSAIGQGSCGGANRGTPRCNTTPFPPPFAPTGWKTILVDHFSIHAADYAKEAAYFNALMGWKVRNDDGTKAVLDIGDWGSVIIRGGYEPPAPPAPPAQVAAALPAAGDAAGGRGGRGRGGRGGGGGRGPARAVWDNFCVGIAPWDTKKVEAELAKRGLNPVADHDASADFYSFHVKDPDGFDFQVSNGNKKNRRTTPANGKLSAPPPFGPTGWKTVYLDHISWQCTSYKESVAFYQALVGWQPLGDEGSQNEVVFAPEIGGALIRGGNANMPGGLRAAAAGRGGRGGRGGQAAAPIDTTAPIVRRTVFNHISFGIAAFDPDKVKEALESRGLNARVDTGATAESPPEDHDIHTAHYKSYHTTTPNGWDLQISDKITAGGNR